MGKLDQVLRKIITEAPPSTLIKVRFDIAATIDGRVFPSDSYTAVVLAGREDIALASANSWLVENLPELIEANITRAELVLSDRDGIKGKQTVRIEELAKAASESITLDTETDQDRMMGLWQGPQLNDDQKDFLTGLYKDYYGIGEGAVDSDIFESDRSRAHQDIHDRLWGHPKAGKPEFVKKLADGDKAALEEILYPSNTPGYAVDFSYTIYEKYFLDSVPVTLDETELEETGLKEAEDEVHFLARTAAADGVEVYVGKLAEGWIEEEAKKWLQDNTEETEQ